VTEQAQAREADSGKGAAAAGRSLWGLVGACIVVLGLLSLTRFVGGWWWFLELFSHYSLHYALCAMVALGICVAGRRWRWAALAAVVLVVSGWQPATLFLGRPAVPERGLPLRMLFANLSYRNADVDAVVEMVAAANPDVVVFAEVTDFWARGLSTLRGSYPNTLVDPRPGPFGIALFSRVASSAGHVVRLGDSHTPTLYAQLQVDGREIALAGAHPPPPIGTARAGERRAQFADIAARVRDAAGPVVLIGDLNCTPYSPYFRKLLRQSGLRDGRRGFGVKATWPVGLGPLGLPIDHCLVSEGITVTSFTLGPDIGSDHRPIAIELVLP
jgi:endonuclease/exonuclease/phosphatase (EEP) superfamily protein YafD